MRAYALVGACPGGVRPARFGARFRGGRPTSMRARAAHPEASCLVIVPPLEGDASGPPSTAPEAGRPLAGEGRPPDTDRWVLQAEAAKQAGCSVSAIRKWRREGSVASRKILTAADLERVEVRLADVLRRAGPRPPPGPASTGEGDARSAVPGTVLVPIGDLEALLDRVAVADRLAKGLESRLRAIDAEAGRLREQFAAFRGQVEAERRGTGTGRPPTNGGDRLAASRTPPPRPRAPEAAIPEPPTLPAEDRPAEAPARSAPRDVHLGPEDRPTRVVPPTFRQWLGARQPPAAKHPATDLERLSARLRRLYGRLEARQGQEEVPPAEAERWVADLAAYDTALVRAASALGVPTGYRVGERLPASDRVALTRALAAAGLDVRQAASSSEPDLDLT